MIRNRTTTDGERPRPAFYAIALALPLLFFAVLEAGIRLTGFAEPEPLFVDGPPGWLRPNESVIGRFFIHPSRAPRVSIDTTFFRREKADDAFRVVIQGGSSAAGFPYGKWASLAGMLGQRLRRAAPEREIEVISTAMSAINSYALLDFADEIIAIEPDAVLIYAGHNEYLGVLGVGSAYGAARSPATTRALLTLRRSHLFRALQFLYGSIAGTPAESATERSGTLMARIARDRAIPFGSDAYRAGIEQFEYNLSALLGRYRKAGIPVFIGTLASNESGQPPFISERGNDESQAVLEALSIHGETPANDADGFFGLGRSLQQQGQAERARRAYGWARDLDALRFRAPAAMNETIGSLADATGSTLVPVAETLADSSRDGIIGNGLMLEHLHPNVRGYFLLADAYFQSLKVSLQPDRWRTDIGRGAAWREAPVTEIDELAGGYRMRYLKSDWPFQEEKQPVNIAPPGNERERIAQDWFFGRTGWQEAMQRALAHYQRIGRLDEAAKIAMNLAEAFPFEASPQYVSGRLLLATGRPEFAIGYLERAVQMTPEDRDARAALEEARNRLGSKKLSP